MYENIIVTETPTELRRLARAVLKGNWKKIFVGVLIYGIFATLIPNLVSATFDSLSTQVYIEEYDLSYSFPAFLNIYQMVLGGILQFGLYAFILRFLRTREIRYDRLFAGFEHMLPAFLLSILISLVVGLWSMLLIVPGVIAWMRYYMAMYVLNDAPQAGVMNAVRTSKYMTQGNKATIFLTILSFIGWRILASLPAGILDGLILMGHFAEANTTLLIAIEFILLIPGYFVTVYMETTMALLYEIMSGRLRKSAPSVM